MRRGEPRGSQQWKKELLTEKPEFFTLSEIHAMLHGGTNLLAEDDGLEIDPEKDRAFVQDCNEWLQTHYNVQIIADFDYTNDNTPSSYTAGETPTLYITNFTAAGLARESMHEICHFLVSSDEERRIDNYNLSSEKNNEYFNTTQKKEQRAILLELLLTIESHGYIENTKSPLVSGVVGNTIERYTESLNRNPSALQIPRDFAGKSELLELLQKHKHIFMG